MADITPGDDGARARRERAAARRNNITVRRMPWLVADGAPVRGEAALSLVAQLTRAAWSLGGHPPAPHDRANMRCVFVPNARAPT